ncbi:galactose oxidase [Russula earlei]|uniref:Galactose oxidase n=1 Tax=Russula earlei TaxID=71964 RepID=A0ACC0U4G8_9AGAM|nr:galactose oxidase [Russula earlei]
MGKKKSSNTQTSKVAAKIAKKSKAAQKTERKEKKKTGKAKDEFDDDQDLEAILENIRREWEAAHAVTEELVEGPPSRRANATLTACPSGDYLWSIGGEFFSEDGKAYFYNDVFRYSPEKDEWRKFVSQTCPGPRSAHAVVASPSGGGKLFLFGGEFSSLYQNTFHHYRDFWCFDIATRSWDRIETKVRPSARSGHRMALWKHYILLFGGFYDPGITTRYMNDLWVFDTQEYRWQQIEYKDPNERRPSPRSGFSFLSTPDGIVLHGGYCKEYTKGKRPVGVMLDDTWLLRLVLASTPESSGSGKTKFDPLIVKWERRKRPSTAYTPALRSGATMALWAAKGMGVLFGGVTDEDSDEETLKSIFWNDLNGYQVSGNGKWVSMMLKTPKKQGGKRKKDRTREDDDENDEDVQNMAVAEPETNPDPDDPLLSTPIPRYNAMLAVLRNTLYMHVFVTLHCSREYTLDDFYALSLDKMDRYLCLKKSDVIIPSEGDDVSSSSEEDDEDDSDEEMLSGEEEAPEIKGTQEAAVEEPVSLRDQATAFMGVSKDTKGSEDDTASTPLPGESLAVFYGRSRESFLCNVRLEGHGEYWAQKARGSSDNRGKLLRRDGFSLAEERYGTYKPILEEVERILAEAGLDEEEMTRASATGQVGAGQNRNRR